MNFRLPHLEQCSQKPPVEFISDISIHMHVAAMWLYSVRLACADEWLPGHHKLPIRAIASDELVQAMSENLARIAVPNCSLLAISNRTSKAAQVSINKIGSNDIKACLASIRRDWKPLQ